MAVAHLGSSELLKGLVVQELEVKNVSAVLFLLD